MNSLLIERRAILSAACLVLWSDATARGSIDTSQDRIAQEVRHELITLPYYSVFDNLDFRVSGDTVTLFGQVTRPALKSAAEMAAKQIEGVSRVDDQIEVLPPSKDDDRMRLAVYVATYGQPTLSQYANRAVPPVHIIVKKGNVTLVGRVDTAPDKTQFFTQASSVPGVVSVTDHLQSAQ